MKRLLTLMVSAILYVSVSSFANQDEKIDTIYLMDGRKISAKVTSISSKFVNFIHIEKSTRDRVGRKNVQKIVYHNGIAQVFNEAVTQPVAGISWQDVRLIETETDVIQQHKRDALEVEVPVHAGAVKTACIEAETQLKKKAAALQCSVVLVTGRENKRLKGTITRYIIKGTAVNKVTDDLRYDALSDHPPVPIINFDLKQYYPQAAKNANIIKNTVILLVKVNEDGAVQSVIITSPPSGYGFDEAAMDVMRRIHFRPGKVGGKPVKMLMTIPITFMLED